MSLPALSPKTLPPVNSLPLYPGFFLVLLIFDHLSYSLPTDVMTTVFKVGAKTDKGWSFLLSKYVSGGSEAEKNKILEALASSEDVWKLYWYETNKGVTCRNQKHKTLCFSCGEAPFSSLCSQATPDFSGVVRGLHMQGFTSGPVPIGRQCFSQQGLEMLRVTALLSA